MLRAYAEEHVDGFIRDLDKVSVSSPNVPVEVHIDFYADGEGPLPSGSIRIAGKGRNLLEAIADAHRAIKDVEIPS